MADKGAFTVANTRAGRIVFRVHFILYPSKDLGSNNGFRFSSGYPYIDMSHFCYGWPASNFQSVYYTGYDCIDEFKKI